MRPRRALRAVAAATVALLAACVGGPGPTDAPAPGGPDGAIRVAAFDFPESRLLAEMYAQALESAGYTVSPVLELGSREIVEPALEQGHVDVVPEYAGSALGFLQRRGGAADARVGRTHRRLSAAFGERGVRVGSPAPAQNQNAFAVTKATAQRFDLRTLTDLADHAEGMKLGGPPECPQRHTCLAGLRTVYGMDFERFLSLTPTSHVAAALAAGEVDVGLLFTTDPAVLVSDFVVLEDDRGLQPAENIVPVVREDVLRRHGDSLMQVLDEVSAELTTSRLARLNRDMVTGSRSPEDIASAWLSQEVLTP